jgi:NitT/TauT family transport system ATP-binding protein
MDVALAPAHVAIEDLSKTYHSKRGDVLALQKLDLKLQRGEFVSLLGPSGCGKSTLLKIVAGVEQPSSGAILIGGKHQAGSVPDGLGMVFQRDVLLDWRTILQNVMLPVEFLNLKRADYVNRAQDLLKLFGLQDFADRHPWELSGGMRQRASICRALLTDPQLLLMDEPFGALDALTRDELNIELQRTWLRTGKTVLFVTHSIPEAIFLSDRVVVMASRPGRIVEIIDIDFPRPRGLAVREEPEFGKMARHIREIFEANGVFGTPTGGDA